MVAISIITISKELMLACRQLGHTVSEALAAVVAATVVAKEGGFFSEKSIDENDAKTVVEEAAKKILSKEKPGISALRLQADYEVAFADIEKANTKHLADAKAAEEKTLAWISKFTAKFDEDPATGQPALARLGVNWSLAVAQVLGAPGSRPGTPFRRDVYKEFHLNFPLVRLCFALRSLSTSW
ncbi:unnamed protein product [Effrenium voratum]|uniref:Uncharacterized protein n=1 Tax=Effrenium voratum TaxID=2562239 RepID=A0AA36J3I5_9DINO|nr:unnamed protein product [Effrenium voratum]